MAGNELEDKLQAIPGVASAEVTLHDDAAPVARVFLDGSRADEEVRDKVNALLGSSVPKRTAPPAKRRGGLGKGLGEILNGDTSETPPAHINSITPRAVASSLSRVGVVETAEGVVVEVVDSIGATESVMVGTDGSIDDAVIEGVRRVIGASDSGYITVRDVETGQGQMVVAAVTTESGERLAGAAFIEYGRPWATANAVMKALADG
ncbi:MAG: hypothetical protein ACR2N2_07300 [Acidimicrobiia bacterium]